MSFLSSFNISASALTAQRMRLDVASENISNIDTTRTEGGGTYQIGRASCRERVWLMV